MLKQGEILKRAIKLSNYSINDVIRKTGISRGTLYNLFKEEVIDDIYKEMLLPLKLDLDFNTNSTKEQNDPNMDAKEKEIEMLRELLKSKEEIIKSKDETIEALRGQSRSDYKGKSRQA